MTKVGSNPIYNGPSWHAPRALVGFDSPPLHRVYGRHSRGAVEVMIQRAGHQVKYFNAR